MRKNNQTGRSMVEMLGVLAIIGVLSVGAIAGYSKAMMNYKINKAIDEISNIVANIRTVFNGKYEGLDIDNVETLKKLNIVPENMWQGTKLVNAFEGSVSIFGYSSHNYSTFSIYYNGLSSDTCIKLATQNWASDGGFLVVGVCRENVCDSVYISDVIEYGQVEIFSEDIEGEIYAPYWEGTMSLERAKQGCACENNNCSVMLGFK